MFLVILTSAISKVYFLRVKIWTRFNLCCENINHLESECLKALCYFEINSMPQLHFVVLLLFLNGLCLLYNQVTKAYWQTQLIIKPLV